MKLYYYLIGSIPLALCIFFVLICVPFIAIGEFMNLVARKIMSIGDRIKEWGDLKEQAK